MNHMCPECHGANVRRSSTPVAERTWRNQIYSRYRCRDCLTQFWVISRKTYMGGATVIGAILLAVIAVFLMDLIFRPDPNPPSRRRAEDGVRSRLRVAEVARPFPGSGRPLSSASERLHVT